MKKEIYVIFPDSPVLNVQIIYTDNGYEHMVQRIKKQAMQEDPGCKETVVYKTSVDVFFEDLEDGEPCSNTAPFYDENGKVNYEDDSRFTDFVLSLKEENLVETISFN